MELIHDQLAYKDVKVIPGENSTIQHRMAVLDIALEVKRVVVNKRCPGDAARVVEE